ncbi:hypothetical protein AKO1_006680 [Acrasis kona]|uniref:FAD-binding FR-type domain-containing protein n=1 Tax=Acrasis kona TaxID=1008807 RepID=A0AAW2ZL44_9EUKA
MNIKILCIFILLLFSAHSQQNNTTSAIITYPPIKPLIQFHYYLTAAYMLFIVVLGLFMADMVVIKNKPTQFRDILFNKRLLPPTKNKLLSWFEYNSLAEMSLGETLLALMYLLVNFSWFAWGYGYAAINGWNALSARGFGWMSNMNAAFLMLPVTRNSVWYKIYGISFERAIKYHKLLSEWNLITVFLHTVCFTWTYYQTDSLHWLFVWGWNINNYSILPGVIGGVLYLAGSIVSLNYFRRNFWNFFLISHIVLNCAATFLVILHAIWFQTVPFLGVAFGLYFVDLILRAFVGYGKTASLVGVEYISKCDIVKLSIHKPGFTYEPGQYIYLWIDAVGMSEAKPFTIACHSKSDERSTVTIYIKDVKSDYKDSTTLFDPWTHRLAVWAEKVQNGQASAKNCFVRMEGPYGSISHDYDRYDTVVLVAGGIGITAMYSLFISLLDKYRNDPTHSEKKVYLIWTKRKRELWNLFPEILKYEDLDNRASIESGLQCNIRLYVTENVEDEAAMVKSGVDVIRGRPDFKSVLQNILDERISKSPFVSVCGCGANQMIADLEEACWDQSGSDAKIHFHREIFEF